MISLATPGHVLYRQKNGGGRTIFVKHPAGIEEHHASADRREFVLDLIGLDGAALRNDVFEERPEPRNVPLPVAQLEDQLAFRLARRHGESPVERAARGNHAQVRVEHEKGLAYGVDDGLGQVMPMRDGGERIAFGHAGSPFTSALDHAGTDSGAEARRMGRPNMTRGEARCHGLGLFPSPETETSPDGYPERSQGRLD